MISQSSFKWAQTNIIGSLESGQPKSQNKMRIRKPFSQIFNKISKLIFNFCFVISKCSIFVDTLVTIASHWI